MKSTAVKIKEGRCQGIGSAYVPFYMANEDFSYGTASLIQDPIENRTVSVLSKTEKDFYYIKRWDDGVEYIREQYLLDADRINAARKELGLRPVPGERYPYTTDFLIDCRDGSQEAYSIKWKEDQFDRNNPKYECSGKKYENLIKRQGIEAKYWEDQEIPFHIVTSEEIDQRLAENIAYVMGFYRPRFIRTREQKLMHLIAHKKYTVPLDGERLNPKKLALRADFDIDGEFENLLKEEMEA